MIQLENFSLLRVFGSGVSCGKSMLYDLGWILVYGLGSILRESVGVSVRHGISPCVHASGRNLNSLFWETDHFSGNEDVKNLLAVGREFDYDDDVWDGLEAMFCNFTLFF